MRSILLSIATLASATSLVGAEFTIDSVHSGALFKVMHLDAAYTYGRFTTINGSLMVDAANPSANKISLSIPVASLSTDNTKRDEHLRGADFFNAKQFPNLTFTSTEWKNVDATTSTVTGNVTIMGVTKPLTVTVTKTGENPKSAFGDHRIGYETTFTIKRSDFGMSGMLDKVGDAVTVTFGVEGIKK